MPTFFKKENKKLIVANPHGPFGGGFAHPQMSHWPPLFIYFFLFSFLSVNFFFFFFIKENCCVLDFLSSKIPHLRHVGLVPSLVGEDEFC